MSGRVVGLSSRFQVGECGALRFNPRLRLAVGSRGHTGIGASTPLTAVLSQQLGEAGILRVSVTFPEGLSARLDGVNAACTSAAFAVGDCEQARIGTAVAITPLLRDPLRGGVYLVRSPGHPLPDIVIALRGQVDFDLIGRVTIPGGTRLQATFGAVPDVPIRRFTLRLVAGRRSHRQRDRTVPPWGPACPGGRRVCRPERRGADRAAAAGCAGLPSLT
jgi:hypothetical protein